MNHVITGKCSGELYGISQYTSRKLYAFKFQGAPVTTLFRGSHAPFQSARPFARHGPGTWARLPLARSVSILSHRQLHLSPFQLMMESMTRYTNCPSCNTTLDLGNRLNWRPCPECGAAFCRDCIATVCPSCRKSSRSIFDSGKFAAVRDTEDGPPTSF